MEARIAHLSSVVVAKKGSKVPISMARALMTSATMADATSRPG